MIHHHRDANILYKIYMNFVKKIFGRIPNIEIPNQILEELIELKTFIKK